jgi:hypothetical protein
MCVEEKFEYFIELAPDDWLPPKLRKVGTNGLCTSRIRR